MAISFNKLKSPVLGLTDVIQVGRLKGCRVVDSIDDFYEYLIWADQNKLLQFNPEVIARIKKVAGFNEEERRYQEEDKPYEDDFEDVPY